MHWQTFTTNAPITPELEEAFRRQAAAAFAMSPQSMGYSISSSMTSRNGQTTSQTSLQVGKATPWTSAEIDMVERYLVGLLPPGHLLGPGGRPIGLIDRSPHHTALSHSTHRTRTHGAPSVVSGSGSASSTISEAGTVSPSRPPRGMGMGKGILKRSKQQQPAHVTSPASPPTHVDVQRHESHVQQGSGGQGNGVFKTISQKFTKKTTIG
ncbi:hypothetical protein IAU59_005610 [Kwoniella sp. CBS 9459]